MYSPGASFHFPKTVFVFPPTFPQLTNGRDLEEAKPIWVRKKKRPGNNKSSWGSLLFYDSHPELELRGFYLQGWTAGFATALWLRLYTFMNISCLSYIWNYSSVEQQQRNEMLVQTTVTMHHLKSSSTSSVDSSAGVMATWLTAALIVFNFFCLMIICSFVVEHNSGKIVFYGQMCPLFQLLLRKKYPLKCLVFFKDRAVFS